MTSLKSINCVCELTVDLASSATITCRENVKSLYYKGSLQSDDTKVKLSNLLSLIGNESYHESFRLSLDGQTIDLEDINFVNIIKESKAIEWELTIKKEALLTSLEFPSSTINEFLFFSVESFNEYVESGLGLDTPFFIGELNSVLPVRIQVYNCPVSFGGARLAIIPTGGETDPQYFLQPSSLPTEEALKKAIHVVSTEAIAIRPASFELTWGDLDHKLAQPFIKSFIQILYVCVASQIFALNKIILNGVKQIELSVELDNATVCNMKQAKELSKLISWCYAEDDYDTRRTLIVDRLSLECNKNFGLINLAENTISETLEQAKSKYRYVISERSDDYRKELKEVYEDIKSFSNDYAEKSMSLTKGLIADLLSIAFIFTIGVFAKAIVYEDILKSMEANILFKAIAVYLISSFMLRFWHAKVALNHSNKLFNEWSDKLHNHIAIDEVQSIKERLTSSPKDHFVTTTGVVGWVHLMFALSAWESPTFLRIVGLW